MKSNGLELTHCCCCDCCSSYRGHDLTLCPSPLPTAAAYNHDHSNNAADAGQTSNHYTSNGTSAPKIQDICCKVYKYAAMFKPHAEPYILKLKAIFHFLLLSLGLQKPFQMASTLLYIVLPWITNVLSNGVYSTFYCSPLDYKSPSKWRLLYFLLLSLGQ